MSDADLHQIPLPTGLLAWAQTQGLRDLELWYSPIAISLEAKLSAEFDASGLANNLKWLAAAIRSATDEAATPWPIVILIDASQLPYDPESAAKKRLRELANDPTWHRGDCALYTIPIEITNSDAKPPWDGPLDQEGTRKLLLDNAPIPDVRVVGAAGFELLNGTLLASDLDATLRDRLLQASQSTTQELQPEYLLDVVKDWRSAVRRGGRS